MLKLLRTLLVATIAVALPACATKRVPPAMDAILLTQSSESLAGQSISIRGCLTKHQHGAFVAPCGNDDWRNLTIVQDPDNVVLAALPALRAKFFYQVKGEFRGVLERQEREPATSGGMVFRLDSVGSIAEHEP